MAFLACAGTNDQSFGPGIEGCRDDFDFTIQFEEIFFSLTPSSILILLSLWRLVVLARRPTVVHAPILQLSKLAGVVSYASLELALLILVATRSFSITSLSISASSLRLAAAICIIPLSLLEHNRSPRPSLLLSTYLFLTLLLDVAQVRTLWLASSTHPEKAYASVFTVVVAIKAVIVVLEARQKTRWVEWDEKDHSPEETSGIYSLSGYAWLNRLFVSGYRNVLEVGDLYPLDTAIVSRQLHSRFAEHYNASKVKGHKHKLIIALARTLKTQLLLPIPSRLLLIGFKFSQPFFISSLIDYLAKPDQTASANPGYGFIGASALIYSGIAISTALFWYLHRRMLFMARASLVSAIYAKATKARAAIGDENESVTLMSIDIERINQGFANLHDIWATFIEVGIGSYLLYQKIGAAFLVPIVFVAICSVGLIFPVKASAGGQKAWMDGVQKRVGLTSSVIASMKNLKISGLKGPVASVIQQLRLDELAAGAKFRRTILFADTCAFSPLLLAPSLTFAIAQQSLGASQLFTSLSYIIIMLNPLTSLYQSLPHLAGACTCLNRIQAFLESPDRDDTRIIRNALRPVSKEKDATTVETSALEHDKPIVWAENASFSWLQGQWILSNICLDIRPATLTMVVGPVASGKSSFCRALLGEMPYCSGEMHVELKASRIGYCDQTPFLSNGTVRDNIVGFSPWDAERYREVIDATMLRADCEALPKKHNTSVGSNGIVLSGGQKARVSLARALYLRTELLVLDDVFSGLDADTEDQVFQRVFGPLGLLRKRGTTAVLCTHSVRHLPAADHVIALGSDGRVVEQGAFEDLLANQNYIHSLGIKSSSSSDHSEEDQIDNAVSTHETHMLTQVATSTSIPEPEAVMRPMIDSKVYKIYFKSMGLILAASLFVCGLSFGFFMAFPNVWLSFWTADAAKPNPSHTNGYYIGIYALYQALSFLSLFLLASLLFLAVISKSGSVLHQNALTTLVRAPLRFFTSTDQGVITNLFSQDLNLVDTELPAALLNTIYVVFLAIAQAGVLASSSPYLVISYPFVAAVLYVLQKFYLRTSKQLRLLDLEAKSPLYTHFLDTTKGVITMRASGFVDENRSKNLRLLDTSQRPAYLLVMIQQWLSCVLNLIVAGLAVLVTVLATELRSSAGITGASLVTLLSIGEVLSGIILFYTQLETSIGAVSRLTTFNTTVEPEERETEDIEPPEDWPQRGEISLRGVSASYREQTEETDQSLALKDITLTILPGEKIAVCGRTGSGKSSFIAVLLKLLDPLSTTADNVQIDGLSLARIDRSMLRQRIIAIPQDAVFLPDGSTFFENLDPVSVSTDGEAESVLKTINLWDFVAERGGLKAGMIASTFSQGQRQLFSLARAVLRRRIRARSLGLGGCGSEGGILLLDEVSSSVDHKTERKMQEVIREEFKNYTVVAVSHRLDMIMDFDRVVVMDRGEIVEVGNPEILARESGSRFGDLCAIGGH
ncbi:ABC multidrug transporter [Xylariaceae sp. FL1272]|nr:ABC multidrug transporter [Xylariaceae sp. FL1272]